MSNSYRTISLLVQVFNVSKEKKEKKNNKKRKAVLEFTETTQKSVLQHMAEICLFYNVGSKCGILVNDFPE